MADDIAESSSEPNLVQNLAPEEHVSRGVDVVRQSELLVDRLDAVRPGVSRVADRHGFTVDDDLSGVGRVRSRQRVDERRFPGPVAADERHHLARVQVDRHAVDGVDTTEGHADAEHLDEWHGAINGLRLGLRFGEIGHGVLLRSVCVPTQGGVETDGGDQHDADNDVLHR